MFTPLPTAEDSIFSLNTTKTDGSVAETYYKLATGQQKGYTINASDELQDQRYYTRSKGEDIEIQGNFIGYNETNQDTPSTGGGLEIHAYRYDQLYKNINIYADFINNYVKGQQYPNSSGGYAHEKISGGGGVAFTSMGGWTVEINQLKGNFINNYVQADYALGGGLIVFADNNGSVDTLFSIKNITGSFISNHVNGELEAGGGALANFAPYGEMGDEGHIKSLNADFINNYAYSANGGSYGGAIYNSGYEESPSGGGSSGVTYIESINGNFTNNQALGKKDTFGGAIYNTGYLHKASGIFSNNTAYSSDGKAFGGAAASLYFDGSPDVLYSIVLDGKELYLIERYSRYDFDHILPDDRGAAVIERPMGENEMLLFKLYFQLTNTPIEEITPEFISENLGIPVEKITPDIIDEIKGMASKLHEQPIFFDPDSYDHKYKNLTEFYNSSFFNNRAIADKGDALGGAIYGTGINIIADNYTSVFDGNTANGKNNALYLYDHKMQEIGIPSDTIGFIETQALTLKTINNGIILFNDTIDGEKFSETLYYYENGDPNDIPAEISQGKTGYTVEILGDKPIEAESLKTPQYVKFNNSIFNAGNVSVTNTTLTFGKGPYGKGQFAYDADVITSLSLDNAAFDLFNQYQDNVVLKGYSAQDSFLHIDLDVENLTADKLLVNGDVEGTTKLVLYPNSNKDVRGKSILFAKSENDKTGNAESFKVFRVYSSPYMFEVEHTSETSGKNEWSLVMNDDNNPDEGTTPTPKPDPEFPIIPSPDNKVTAEVVAYQGMHSAAIEQTRSMLGNVKDKVGANGAVLAANEKFDALYNAWVNPIYHTATIDAPVKMDVDIWGLEAGFDIQRNQNHKLGVFASYRQGNYDLSGKGKKHYSPVGSEIDIDSYISGLYYRYDYRHLWTFATVYGGVQQADIKTDDGVKADTDGTQIGASLESGYLFNLSDTLKLEPSFSVFYTQVDFDDVKDKYGKIAKYDTIRQTEIELGAKLEKYLPLDSGIALVYVKPSVVQVITSGDSMVITNSNKMSTYEDGTLGRIELGGRYAITDKLSTYGFANYTFGSDYDATSLGFGLNYNF